MLENLYWGAKPNPRWDYFVDSLSQHRSEIEDFMRLCKLPRAKKFLGYGIIGFAFTTTDDDRILKISEGPTAHYEFDLAKYAQTFPDLALCPVYATLQVGDFYLTWKKRLDFPIPTSMLSEEKKEELAAFSSTLCFKSNFLQDEINKKTPKELDEIWEKARSSLQRLKMIKALEHIAAFLKKSLDKGFIIQDLRLDNLGTDTVNNKPVLRIFDGILLRLPGKLEFG
jgi:hypothetical protein